MTRRLPLYALAVLAGSYGLAPIADGDVFWNLNVGHWMLEHRSLLPAADPFTYNAQPGGVQHEWLLQVLFASIDRAVGLTGLRLLGALTCGAAVLLCAGAMLRRGASIGAATVGAAAWWIVVEPHAVIRPHLLAWLFALWVLGWQFASQERPSRRDLVVLFVVCAAWANAHASALIAPFYAVLAALSVAARELRGTRDWAQLRPWVGRGAVSGLAALCTPAGWQLVPYALKTPAVNRELSFEWWPLLRSDVWHARPAVLVTWGALVLLTAAAWWGSARKRPRGALTTNVYPGPLLATVALVHAALTRRMTAFLFLPVMTAVQLPQARSWLGGNARADGLLSLSALLLVAWLHGGAAKSTWTATPLVEPAFPVATTAFLKETRLQGRPFNPDGWGGYIAYRVPGRQVFADGRWPLVGRQVIHDGFAMMLRREDVTPLLDRYAIAWAVFRTQDYLRVPGPDPAQWRLAWQEPTALVLLRRGPHWAENLARTCAFYRRFDAPERAQWPLKARAPAGVRSPTGVPSVLPLCAAAPPTAGP